MTNDTLMLVLSESEREQVMEIAIDTDDEELEDIVETSDEVLEDIVGASPRGVVIKGRSEIITVREAVASALETGAVEFHGLNEVEDVYERASKILCR